MASYSPAFTIFMSYSHADNETKKILQDFLISNFSDIEILSDDRLLPAVDWKEDLTRMRSEADLFLLLVSRRYIESKTVKELELPEVMRRAINGEAYVLPIILEYCDWHSEPYARYQALPRNVQPLNEISSNKAEFFNDLKLAVESIRASKRNRKANRIIQQEKTEQTRYLDLTDCELESIPRDLLDMPWLEKLTLDKNYIRRIENLGNLSALRDLSIVSNEITVLENLDQLSQLVSLDIQRNKLTGIEAVGKLSNLKMLGVSSNELLSLKGVEQLQQLETLYAAHNRLSSVEELDHLNKLKRIVLTNNRIQSLKPLLGHIQRGLQVAVKYSFNENEEGIFIRDNQSLAEPSVEVIEKGRDAILRYFNHAEQYGTKKLEIVKLILVGNSKVGKTNFSEFLRNVTLSDSHNSTHLLDIQNWDASFLRSQAGTPMRVHIFDFGGQDYYHDSHRMYYSHDTAYILLWDPVTNNYSEEKEEVDYIDRDLVYENYPLEYWLESIHYNLADKYRLSYGQPAVDGKNPGSMNTAPVLVLQNKLDLGEGRLDQKRLTDKYTNISGFFSVSLAKQKRTQVLNEVLSDYLNALNLSGRQLIEYEHKIIEDYLLHPRDFKVISLEEFWQECIKIIGDPSINFTKENAQIVAEILNATGIIYFDKKGESDGSIFTQIRRLNEMIKEIMQVAKEGNDKGIVNYGQLKDIPYMKEVLALLTKNNSIIALNENQFVVAQFLPVRPDPSIEFFLKAFTYNQVRFIYKAYFHKTLLLSVFSKYVSGTISGANLNIRNIPFWRNGIIVTKGSEENKPMIFVEFVKTSTHGIINIRSMRPYDRNGLEREIENTFDQLNRGWTVSKEVSVNSKDFFDVDYLKQEVKNLHYEFSANGRLFSVNDFKQIVDFEKLPKKLFISYSSKNSEFIKRFVTHLEVLKSAGVIDPWYDRMIESGSKWDDTIRSEMKQSDVVIFLLSPDFLATEYIMKTEIPLAIEQMSRERSKFFFIELQPCGWKRTEIAKYQQTDDAEVQAKNIITIGKPDNDEAWNRVIDELEKKMNE